MSKSTQKHPTTIKVGNRFLTPLGIGRNGLSIIDCISELIANSFDWSAGKLPVPKKVKIYLIIGDDYIQVTDNGAGMNQEDLDTAINLAEAEDAVRDKLGDQARKGMYGMGLKIAALTLGWKFEIRTKSHEDSTIEHYFKFNSRNLVDKESKYLEKGLFIESFNSEEGELKAFQHGTSITITDLQKRYLPSMNAIKDELEDRFMVDINSLTENIGIEFKLIRKHNDFPDEEYRIEHKDVSVLFEDNILKCDFENPTKWNARDEYVYTDEKGNQHQLKGFLQLLQKRSVADQNYGLNLFYQGQLIERFHKGSLLTIQGRGAEKTYGELHLDGCTPDPSKKNFIEDSTFRKIAELIAEDLKTYKRLSPTSKDAKQRIRQEIDKRKGIKFDFKDSEKEDKSKKPDNETKDKEQEKFPDSVITIDNKLRIQITKDGIYKKPLIKDRGVNWESVYLPSKEHNDVMMLKVYINPNCELFRAIEDLYSLEKDKNKITDFYKRIAICECIYEKLTGDHKIDSEKAREITDNVVYPQVLKLAELN